MTEPLTPVSTPCVEAANLFQHPLIEEPPTSSAGADARRQYLMLARKAQNVCLDCPLMQQCLYNAVVRHDVSGYVAGTSYRERQAIRARLGIRVEPEDLDSLAGVTARNRQIDGTEVVRLRHANPHESLEVLAHRLGCSLSTVKRHLRKARAEAGLPGVAPTPEPTMTEVLDAAAVVLNPARRVSPAPTRRVTVAA